MKIRRSIFILLLLLIGCISINAQKEGCGVTRYFVDLNSKISTSRFSLGQFLIENDEDEVVKYFQDKESGIKLSVGVQKYTSSFKDVPKKIRLRISLQVNLTIISSYLTEQNLNQFTIRIGNG